MTTRLIVNADDFGESPAVSEGILYGHENGIITSTTALINLPGAAYQVWEAKTKHPRLGMGVHLTLTEGRPLLPVEKIRSITEGRPVFPEREDLMSRLDSLDFNEVEQEWTAQIELFHIAAGQAPDHLDSHHYLSNMHPELFRITLQLAERYGCAVRAACLVEHENDPDNPPVENRGNLPALKKMLSASKIPRPRYFQHSFYDEEDYPGTLRQVLENLPNGVTELMVHPGRVDDDLLERSSYTVQRQKELDALTEPGLKDWLVSRGVKLIHFGDL